MGIIARQGLLNTLIIYSGFILGYVNMVLLMPKFFDSGEIGARETIVSYALIVSQIGAFGLGSSYTKFFYKYRKLMKNGLFESFILLAIVSFFVTAVIFGLISPFIKNTLIQNAPISYRYFDLIFVLSFFYVINYLFARGIF